MISFEPCVSFGKPEIIDSVRGSKFTSEEFVSKLQEYDIQTGMDERGRSRNNAKMERFRWTLKFKRQLAATAVRCAERREFLQYPQDSLRTEIQNSA